MFSYNSFIIEVYVVHDFQTDKYYVYTHSAGCIEWVIV